MLSRIEAERQRRAEGEGGVLAPIVVQRRVADLDGAVGDSIEHLQAGDDFAGRERLDLEPVVGDVGHALAEIFTATVERIKRLRPACGVAPFDFRVRLRDRGRRHCARGKTDAGHFQEITTFHALPSPLLPMSSTRAAILLSPFASPMDWRFCLYLKLGLSNPYAEAFRKTERNEIPDCAQDGQTLPGNQEHTKGATPAARRNAGAKSGVGSEILHQSRKRPPVPKANPALQTDASDIIC